MFLPRLFSAVAVVVLSLAATACGSETEEAATTTTSSSSTTSTTTAEQAILTAARDYAGAFFRGDGATVYASWSARCQAKETKATADEAANGAVALYGNAREIESHATVTGDRAIVYGTYDIAALNDSKGKAWVKENGAWKWDGC